MPSFPRVTTAQSALTVRGVRFQLRELRRRLDGDHRLGLNGSDLSVQVVRLSRALRDLRGSGELLWTDIFSSCFYHRFGVAASVEGFGLVE
jgi:hypothetical protein